MAIIAVVAFHAKIPGFGGGFTGVDVFFVISGWLITRNLLLETGRSGRVALGDFWARRIRRLVPALSLVVALTLVAARLLVPEGERTDLAAQALSAVFYLSNFQFIRQSVDYFAADVTTSPFLHTWSLGVEEQFYVIWPILISLVCLVVRFVRTRSLRRPENAEGLVDRRMLIGLFTAVFVVSFVHNLVASRAETNYVFFSITTRAWEFAVAGLLAAVAMPAWLRARTVRLVLGGAGLVCIVSGVVVLRQTPSYPGVAALVPVLGTLAVIAAGETFAGEVDQPGVSRILAARTPQWIGRVSYSWYLWHWPAMVIAVAALPAFAHPELLRTLVGLGTLPVAWAAYRYFETPVRFAPVLTRAPWRTFVAAGALTVLLTASILSVGAPRSYERIAADLDASLADLQAPAGASMEERVATAVGLYRARTAITCPRGGTPLATGDIVCFDGTRGAAATVMLMGDSHAGQWRRTFHQLGRAHDFEVIVREHDGCPPMNIALVKGTGDHGDAKREVCEVQQAGDPRVVAATKPDLVVLAFWVHQGKGLLDARGERIPLEEEPAEWERQTVKLIEGIQAQGSKVAILLDAPFLSFDPSTCLVRKGSERCTMSRSEMLERDSAYQTAIRDAARQTGASYLDLPRIVCTPNCQTEIDGVLTYVDEHHFTDAYALALKGQIWALLRGTDPGLDRP